MGKKAKGGKKGKKGGEAAARQRAEAINDIEGEEYKEILLTELSNLMQETDSENRFASLYQQERERINYFWMAEKKQLEEQQADMRNKEWSLQELKEKHDIEIKACKQRIKHLLFNNLDNLVDEKHEAEVHLKNAEDEHRYKQRELKYDVRALKVQEKETETGHDSYMRAFMKEEDKKKMELRQEFEQAASDLKNKYCEKMNRLRTKMESQKKAIIKQIEAKMNTEIKQLTGKHQTELATIKSYYKNINDANFTQLRTLQTEVVDLRSREVTDLKTLQKLENEERRFEEPTKETYAEVELLTKKEEEYRRDKAELHAVFEKITKTEEEIRQWTWETEVLAQKLDYVIKERDAVYEKFTNSIAEVQQKVGLKNLILEKKLETIQETLEAKEVQLFQVMSAANLTPDARAQIVSSLEDVENAKNEDIAAIQAELKKIREAHSNMVKTYEGKLFEFGIPVEELGFDPLVPANT